MLDYEPNILDCICWTSSSDVTIQLTLPRIWLEPGCSVGCLIKWQVPFGQRIRDDLPEWWGFPPPRWKITRPQRSPASTIGNLLIRVELGWSSICIWNDSLLRYWTKVVVITGGYNDCLTRLHEVCKPGNSHPGNISTRWSQNMTASWASSLTLFPNKFSRKCMQASRVYLKNWPKLYIHSFFEKILGLAESLDVVMGSCREKNLSRVDVRVSSFQLLKGSRTDGDRSRVGCSQHSRFHLPRVWCIGRCIGCIIENPGFYVF